MVQRLTSELMFLQSQQILALIKIVLYNSIIMAHNLAPLGGLFFMKKITLSRNMVAKVDDSDYELLSNFKWHYTSQGYALANMFDNSTSKYKSVPMHRFIIDAPEGYDVDHINRDKLDNRRNNLRIASRSENKANSNDYKNNKSGFRGVSWDKSKNKWKAQITFHGACRTLARSDNPQKLANIYNEEAKKIFGEFHNSKGII